MRQLELANIKSARRTRTPPPARKSAPLVLKDEELREVLGLMAQAIIAVARSEREGGDER